MCNILLKKGDFRFASCTYFQITNEWELQLLDLAWLAVHSHAEKGGGFFRWWVRTNQTDQSDLYGPDSSWPNGRTLQTEPSLGWTVIEEESIPLEKEEIVVPSDRSSRLPRTDPFSPRAWPSAHCLLPASVCSGLLSRCYGRPEAAVAAAAEGWQGIAARCPQKTLPLRESAGEPSRPQNERMREVEAEREKERDTGRITEKPWVNRVYVAVRTLRVCACNHEQEDEQTKARM